MTSSETVLVTGASGYIAGHIIDGLLSRGYNVRGTVRSLRNHQTKYKYLYDLQDNNKDSTLELVSADLTSDKNWNNVIKGCDYIISVASPMPSPEMSDDQIIKIAVDGIKRILNICLSHKNSIKRFILTSSSASHVHQIKNHNKSVVIIDNNSWSDVNNNDRISGYQKAKTLQEEYLWSFMQTNNNPFECVSISPAGKVIGPLLNNKLPSSVQTITAVFGTFPFLPDWAPLFVDVRDVALCHINALKAANANGNRYLVGHHAMWLKDVGVILKETYGENVYSIRTNVQYDFIWKLIGKFHAAVNEFVVSSLGVIKIANNQQTIKDLDVQFRPLNRTILDCAESLIKFGLVQKKSTASILGKKMIKISIVVAMFALFVYACQF